MIIVSRLREDRSEHIMAQDMCLRINYERTSALELSVIKHEQLAKSVRPSLRYCNRTASFACESAHECVGSAQDSCIPRRSTSLGPARPLIPPRAPTRRSQSEAALCGGQPPRWSAGVEIVARSISHSPRSLRPRSTRSREGTPTEWLVLPQGVEGDGTSVCNARAARREAERASGGATGLATHPS